MSKTPYAVLLLDPRLDDDATVRRLYHAFARQSHPDITGVQAVDAWYAATQAYTALKTQAARAAWRKAQRMLSRLCPVCDGYGVTPPMRRRGQPPAICDKCKGVGRLN